MQKDGSRIRETLAELYSGETLQRACNLIKQELYAWRTQAEGTRPLTEKDAMLITYGDAITRDGEKPLQTLRTFLNEHLDGEITNVHLLPIFPYTSDDGFSVADYQTVDPALGSWEDVTALGQDFGVMLDAVVNHTSQSHEWFQRCLRCETPYRDYYIACDPNADYTSVIRPRTLPLLTAFQTAEGQKHYWTTFSEDQVDVNYSSPELLREIIHVLLTYASYGARFIRLDAIGFAWKQQGTGCMSLPKTHTLVRLMRQALEITYPDTKIITETNVPHEENISYFGEGNEAHLVYQFPLPPLTMFTLLTQNAERLTSWAAGLAKTPLKPDTTYFNFLASHDGIGFRPVLGILDEQERQILLDATVSHGGRIGYKSTLDGGVIPYELNINYMDALTDPSELDDSRLARFMAAQAIMLSMPGLPGIYYHSLLGSRNWSDGMLESGVNRRINREKLKADTLVKELAQKDSLRARVLAAYRVLLRARGASSAFSPYASQTVLQLEPRVFALERFDRKSGERVSVRINVSSEPITLNEQLTGIDLLSEGTPLEALAPYQTRWIRR